MSGLRWFRRFESNPTVMQGSSASFAATGTTPPSGGMWDIVRAGTTVATPSATNGWSVGYNSSTSQFTVGAPASATIATGYSVRGYFGSPRSATFDVVGAGPPQLSAVSVSPASVYGGSNATGTVTLSGSLPTSPVTVTLSSNNAAATVPASVTVATGSSSATFTVTTTAVTMVTTVTITATQGSVTKTATLTINPPPTLVSLAFVPAGVTDGSSSSGTVTLSGAAIMDTVVSLSSANSAATVPSNVTVYAGQTKGYFTVTTTTVATQATGNITATFNGASVSQAFNVYPPQFQSFSLSTSSITGGLDLTATITLDGPAPAGGIGFGVGSSVVGAVQVQSGGSPIPAGQSSGSCTIHTTTVNAPLPLTMTATCQGTQRSAPLMLYPSNLHLTAVVGANALRLEWDAYAQGTFSLYRDGVFIASLSSSTKTYDDVFTPTFTSGQAYLYQLYDVHTVYDAQNVPHTVTDFLSATKVYPYSVVATDNQAVDSRLDLRYSTNVFLDYNFGAKTYKGGLFTGFAPGSDQSKVGRSFAHFTLPAPPTISNATYRMGNMTAYFTGASGAINNLQIGCQALSNNPMWDAATLKWTTAPTFTPNAATNAIGLTYNPTSPTPGWKTWDLSGPIRAAQGSGQPMSVAWASMDETVPGWAYFAKKEYDANLAPRAGYAWEDPQLIRVTASPFYSNPLDPRKWDVYGLQVQVYALSLKITVNGIGLNDQIQVTLNNGKTGAAAHTDTFMLTGLNNSTAVDAQYYSGIWRDATDASGHFNAYVGWTVYVNCNGQQLVANYKDTFYR